MKASGARHLAANHPRRALSTPIGCLRSVLPFAFAAVVCTGCARRTVAVPPSTQAPVPAPGAEPVPPQPAPPSVPQRPGGIYVEQGIASWYGVPFNGRRTSDGEIYDMYQFTAAHRTLPFGSMVQVTNLTNGKRIEVRINDRGPFVANRIIDLSLSAARALEIVGPGTAPVRLEVVGGPNPAVGLFGVQVGAFQVEDNAQRLRERLAAKYSPVTVVPYDSPNGLFYRVRVGRMASEDTAQQLAGELRLDGQPITFVVRLDE